MKLRYMYLINTAVALIFAIGLLLMTPVMLGIFHLAYTKDAVVLSQFIAVELTVSGLITLLARDVTDPAARSAINYGNIVGGVLGFVIALNATLTGVLGMLGYVVAALYILIAGGFVYFQFFGPAN